MKSLRITLILTIVTVALLSSGLVAALNPDQATARVVFSREILPAGQPITGTIFFSSNSSNPLTVTAVSIHFDWMPSGQVVGYQLTTPVTIESGGSHLFDPMQIQLPTNIDSGTHTYYIGIDGTQNGVIFSWDSPQAFVDVTGGTSSVTTAPSSTNSGGEQQDGQQPDLQLYGAVAAVVVIVVLLVIVLVLRRKRTKTQPEPSQPAVQQESPPPEQKPEQKPSSGQDFDI